MKFLKNLEEAEESVKRINHMVYASYPLIQDKKLLLKILLEIKIAMGKCISAILQYEYLYRRVRLSKNPQENLKSFMDKCAPRYEISVYETQKIKELFEIVEKHKISSMEFKKNEKIVILSDNSPPKVVDFENIKEFLRINKQILEKARKTFKGLKRAKV